MGKNGLFRLPLALAVVVVQLGLGAGGDQHRRGVPGGLQIGQQRIRQARIARVKFRGVGGAVDAGKMHHKRGPAAVIRQSFGGVILFKQHQVGIARRAQGGHQIFAHKTACAGDENGGVLFHDLPPAANAYRLRSASSFFSSSCT